MNSLHNDERMSKSVARTHLDLSSRLVLWAHKMIIMAAINLTTITTDMTNTATPTFTLANTTS
jgi:hypothetical protein